MADTLQDVGSTQTTAQTQATTEQVLIKQNEDLKKQVIQSDKDLTVAKATIKSQSEEIAKLNKMYVDAGEKLAESMLIIGSLEKNQKPVEGTVSLPEVGSKVIFINHSGAPEKATVIAHSGDRVHLSVQGEHPNDKYILKDVSQGGPGKPHTFFKGD